MRIRLVPTVLCFAAPALLIGLVVRGEAGAGPSRTLAAGVNELHLRASLKAMGTGQQPFTVSSRTFENNGFIPASMVFSGTLGSTCTGGNESPELSWTQAPGNVQSYAVVLFDVTASFTHWGMYNIPVTTTELPENAGVAGSTFGAQVSNDALNFGYSGPCPPPDIVKKGIHTYVFTVYALDTQLQLAFPSPDFPPTGAALFRAMIGHVVDTASITGLFRCTDENEGACS
jgi:Raf kinase inhibitor-like YbhB/YbcL family protein